MNVPNALSLLRLVMVPVFCLVYFLAGEYAHYLAGMVYALATFTDFLDGYIARKYNLISRLGRILDPLADKLMSFAVLMSLVIKGLIPWWAAAIYFVKEAFMGIGALVQYKKVDDVPPSNFLGKFSTVFFFSVCLLIMLLPWMDTWISTALVCLALAFTIAAFTTYLAKFLRLTKDKKTNHTREM